MRDWWPPYWICQFETASATGFTRTLSVVGKGLFSDGGERETAVARNPSTLRGSSVLHSQEFHLRRRDKDFAESMHPVAGLLARFNSALAELIELFEIGEFDFELQRRIALAACQWH